MRLYLSSLQAMRMVLDKTGGRRYYLKCPWHGPEKHPSLVVYPDGRYFCFGCRRRGKIYIADLVAAGLDISVCKVIDEQSDVIDLSSLLAMEYDKVGLLTRATSLFAYVRTKFGISLMEPVARKWDSLYLSGKYEEAKELLERLERQEVRK